MEKKNRLGTNQIARRKNTSVIETATINELILESHRLNTYSLLGRHHRIL